MVCFFGKSTNFLPSPMVARNAWGSKARLFLPATLGLMELRTVCSVASIGVWRAILLLPEEPLGWRAGDMAPPSALTTKSLFYRFPGQCKYTKTKLLTNGVRSRESVING